MKRQRPPRWRWVIASVFITSTLTVLLAWPIIPRLKKRVLLNQLTAPDLTAREQALSYVVGHAQNDPAVLQAAIRHLDIPDQSNFLQLVNALDRAGQWRRPPIPDTAWLRWIAIMGNDPSAEAKIMATQLVADLSSLADHPLLADLLKQWFDDANPDVRYNALIAAAELAGIARNRHSYETLIAAATGDQESEIARHAWILLGLLDPSSGISADWRGQRPEVAAAILWATTRTNPDHPQPAIEAVTDASVEPAIRAAAVYALHQSDSPTARDALIDLIPPSVDQVNDQNQPLIWRAILSLNVQNVRSNDRAQTAIEAFLASALSADLEDPRLAPLILSATLRVPRWGGQDLVNVLHSNTQTLLDEPLVTLAVLEGLEQGRTAIQIPDPMPDLLRWAAVAVMKNPSPADLRYVFASPRPAMRDLACLVAAQRFSPQQNEALAASLLTDFNDDAKCSGAILAGLTGSQPKLLAKKQRHEDIWHVQQVMALGMWMQGQALPNGVDIEQLAPNLLLRPDVPTTTVLLAMLHKGHPAAMDYLLNPKGEERLSLTQLFDQSRWWYVLRSYLPPDAPLFWVWGDPDLAQFQVDVLRDWYLLARHRLRRVPDDP